MRYFVFALMIIFGCMPVAYGSQLNAEIFSDEETIEPSFKFLRVIYIEYPNGGEIAELLQGKKQTIFFSADSSNTGMRNLINKLNENIHSIPSDAFVTDAKLSYQVILSGNENWATIEYKIELLPSITNYVVERQDEKSTLDANWRGIKIDDPLVIDTKYGPFDINNPKSALEILIPDVIAKIPDYEIKILETTIIDASGILKLPLHKWQSLFDNTAIIPGSKEYKYSGEYVITHYTMGECSVEVGACKDRMWIHNFETDEKYSIKMVESQDDAAIAIEGYADSSIFAGIEVFHTSLKTAVYDSPETVFPAGIIYGMAGVAAMGGIVMFVISNRKIKNDKDQGQTGIDPSKLKFYENINLDRENKTNKGELNLRDNSKPPIFRNQK